ncbi:DNA polymerase III subunit chi [Parasphingorhabdus sp.]|uniref:DNA polymerase III subunit chi n=1 Tax=Parasphingorhabdus sp. TaxID=2709688 RepID=UPI0032645985
MSSEQKQVDFYYLTRDPVEKLVAVLAQKTLDGGDKLLLVSSDFEQIEKMSAALWDSGPASFLAHGIVGCPEDKLQPVLISDECDPVNQARFVALSDGQWRDEALDFDRTFYLFTQKEVDAARQAWRDLSTRENVTPRYWKQDGGRWVQGP